MLKLLTLKHINMKRKEIIAQLIKDGAKKVTDCVIRNVTVTTLDEYTRLGLTLDQEVDGYIAQEDGSYAKGKTEVIFASTYAISSILKDNDDAAFAANYLVLHPNALSLVLSRAKIDIIQELVEKDTEYKNPFAKSQETITFDHDTIINHIISIEPSEFGMKSLDRLAEKMLEM